MATATRSASRAASSKGAAPPPPPSARSSRSGARRARRHPDLAEPLVGLGEALHKGGDAAAAATAYESARVALAESVVAGAAAIALHLGVGELRLAGGDLDGAADPFALALRLRVEASAPAPTAPPRSRTTWRACAARGEWAGAEALHEAALATREASGLDHPDRCKILLALAPAL